MRLFICTLLSLLCLISALPSFAIDAETIVLPGIGHGAQKVDDYVQEVSLDPITLPKKISNFEFLEAERALAPNFLRDQTGFWTAPFRVKVRDLAWLIPASGILTTLLLVDDDFSKALTNNHHPSTTQTDISKAFAQIGGYAPILGLPGGLLLTGAIAKNDRLRETGVLQYEALGNAAILGTVSQLIAGRNKPNNAKKGRGEFFEGGTSFPSGHSIASWALASVASRQYPDKKWVPVVGYTLASLVSVSRVLQGTHYPSDMFAGAVLGYLIGKYVVKYRSKHSPRYKDKESTSKQ